MLFVCILGEVDISYIFCFIFRDLLIFICLKVPIFLILEVGTIKKLMLKVEQPVGVLARELRF